jgi:hypothetical protein
MAATKPTPKTVRRRMAIVEYDDGKVEEYNLGKPIYEYELTQCGIDALNNPEAIFWLLWQSAGKPGANGEPLDQDRDRPKMKAWIASLEAYEFPDAEDVPPTTPRAASRT